MTIGLLVSLGLALAQDRPPLLYREDFKETPAATPITQDHIANPALTLNVYGPGKAGVKKSHHDKPLDDPYYVWSGTANGNWLVSFRHRDGAVNLTGLAKIRWRTKQAGFRQLRIALKLVGGQWIVSEVADGPSTDWHEAEFPISGIRWRVLKMPAVTEAGWVANPDLTQVEEIGFTDLMVGGNSDACSRLDWIEVYGVSQKRP